MAAAAFSIRGYAVSMRGAAAAEGQRPFGVVDLPPMEAPTFRWWEDELASAVAAAASASASPRRSLGKAKPPKKRSISDLFAAAPPLDAPPAAGSSGGSEQPEVDDDEALCAIVRRTKEEKKRKRRLQEEAAAAAAPPEGSGGPEAEGNFATRKEALDKPNSPDGLDTQTSKKPEGVQHLRKDEERISEIKRKKHGKIKNIRKKKADRLKYTESKKANKVRKPRDLEKTLTLHSILKKYTKHTSVKMVKEKHVNSKGTEVIELCRKSVKRVKFSEANDVLGSKMQNGKLPKRQSIRKLFSDAMTSSSSSYSSSSSSSSAGMSSEGDKCITAESSTSHMPEEFFTKAKAANKNTGHLDTSELSNTEPSSPLIDLNKALPESTDLNYTYDSNSEVPDLGHTHDGTSNPGVPVLDGRENQRDLSFDSQRLECQPHATGLERIRTSRLAGTLLHGEAFEVSDMDIVGPPLIIRELAETHRDCSNVSVKDTRTTAIFPCALPDRAVQDSFQQHQNWFSTNLNHGSSRLSIGGKFPSWRSRECNMSRSENLHFHSEFNQDQQHECAPSTGQIVRLMGKDLAVSTTRGECSAETAQKPTGTSINDHLKTNMFLELPRQGQPFLSLQAQSFPNVLVNSTAASHASAYSASTSQEHLGYRTPHDFSHPFPAANVLSGDRSPYEYRFGDFVNSQPNRHVLLGCPPLSNHGSAAFHQNPPPPWRYYSGPFTRTEPPTAPFLPTTRQHGTPSSVSHAILPRPYGVHPASSSVHSHSSASFTFSHPGRIIQEASDSRRDAALPSRNPDNEAGRAVPDNSNASSSGRYVHKRSGPVKLTPGAKHILVPSDSTGDGNSIPVYSCVSFGSRGGNASVSQNKGA